MTFEELYNSQPRILKKKVINFKLEKANAYLEESNKKQILFPKKYLGPHTVERARVGDRPDMTVYSGILAKSSCLISIDLSNLSLIILSTICHLMEESRIMSRGGFIYGKNVGFKRAEQI